MPVLLNSHAVLSAATVSAERGALASHLHSNSQCCRSFKCKQRLLKGQGAGMGSAASLLEY